MVKTILLNILILSLSASSLYAEFVYVEKGGNLVLGISDKDCLSFPGHDYNVVEMTLPKLKYNPSLYRYENSRFILDKDKVETLNKTNREFNIHILAKTETIKLGYELLFKKGLATKEEVDKNIADIVKMRNAKLKPIIQIEDKNYDKNSYGETGN